MKRMKEMAVILVAALLVCPVFSWAEEEYRSDLSVAELYLCFAAETGDKATFRDLMKESAKPNLNCKCYNDGSTPLTLSVVRGYHTFAEMLIEAGAQVDALSLQWAIEEEYGALVDLFLSKNPDLCLPSQEGPFGYPASTYAPSDWMQKKLLNAEKKANLKVDSQGRCTVKKR